MAKQRAIGALVMFVIGIWFAIPSQANIGWMIVDALAEGLTQTTVIASKGAFILFGVIIIFGDIGYIISQLKDGNF